MAFFEKVRPYLPLIVGVIIVAIIAVLMPWGDIYKLFKRIKPETFVFLFILSAIYYLSKTFRFWVMLRQLGIKKSYFAVAISYLAAQPVALLPAGEYYRSVLLKKYTGVPIHKSSPTVFMQSLIEGIVLLTGALIGAISLGKNQFVVLGVAVILVVLLVAIKRGWLTGLSKVVNKLPLIDISAKKMDKFLGDNEVFLKRRTLPLLLLISSIPVICGVLIVYLAADSIGGQLSLMQSAIAYCLPVVLSGLSFLPGGLGASEGGTIGLLRLMNLSTPQAAAITLLVRIFTLGAGLLFGVLGIILAAKFMEARND